MKKGTEINGIERKNEKDLYERGQHLIAVLCDSVQHWVILLDISSC
jgi:hypothetical protein